MKSLKMIGIFSLAVEEWDMYLKETDLASKAENYNSLWKIKKISAPD